MVIANRIVTESCNVNWRTTASKWPIVIRNRETARVPSSGWVPESKITAAIHHGEQAVAASEDLDDLAAVVDWGTESNRRVESVEVEPVEGVVASENEAEVGAGLLGVLRVEFDEIRAVD